MLEPFSTRTLLQSVVLFLDFIEPQNSNAYNTHFVDKKKQCKTDTVYCKGLWIIADMKALPWHLFWGLNLHPTPDKSASTGTLPWDHLIDVKFSMQHYFCRFPNNAH